MEKGKNNKGNNTTSYDFEKAFLRLHKLTGTVVLHKKKFKYDENNKRIKSDETKPVVVSNDDWYRANKIYGGSASRKRLKLLAREMVKLGKEIIREATKENVNAKRVSKERYPDDPRRNYNHERNL